MIHKTAIINSQDLAKKINNTRKKLHENFDPSNLTIADKAKLLLELSEAEELAKSILEMSKK